MKKFEDAFRGITTGLKHRSIRVQFILALMAFCAAVVMRLKALEWVTVIICIGLVIGAEMLNTCVEMLCDLYTTEYNEEIRKIKDIAAGAVLVASAAALLSALILLGRHVIG